jgi:hypothetical protein
MARRLKTIRLRKAISRRKKLVGVRVSCCFLMFVFLILLITRTLSKHDNYLETENLLDVSGISLQEKFKQNVTITIEGILNDQRKHIMEQMQNYPNKRFGVDAKSLYKLTPETGGNPIRSVIISSWRSGSTFLGDIINAQPGSFYNFEPLFYFGTQKIRGQPNGRAAVETIKKLLTCNYTGINDFLRSSRYHRKFNKPLYAQCQLLPQLCYQPKFLASFCELFPMQSMKVVGLSMKLAANLLMDLR